jgi:hypothetical protein
MRSSARLIALVVGALVALGCGRLSIHTMSAPGVRWDASTYRLLDGPAARYGPSTADAHDPMIAGSPANRILRARIAEALEMRGYRREGRGADITIAFYASVRADVDVTRWSYGYAFIPDWPRWPTPPLPSPHEGRLIVDVLDPSGMSLLWRGEATMKLTRDVDENLSHMADLASDVVQHMPAATRHRVLATAATRSTLGGSSPPQVTSRNSVCALVKIGCLR